MSKFLLRGKSQRKVEEFPKGLIPCDYIESNGSQYLNTMLSYILGDSISIKFSVLNEINPYTDLAFFGGYGTAGICELGIIGMYYRGNVGSGDTKVPVTQHEVVTATLGEDYKWYVNDVLVDSKMASGSANNTTPLLICGRYYNGKVTKLSSIRLYSYTHSRNGIELINLIPVLRMADCKPVMYDTVSQCFFENNGEGEFDYRITDANGMQFIKYIENKSKDGFSRAMIDSGICLNDTIFTELSFQFGDYLSSMDSRLFGSYGQSKGYGMRAYKNYFTPLNTGISSSFGSTDTDKHVMRITRIADNLMGIEIDGVSQATVNNVFQGNSPAYILGTTYRANANSEYQKFSGQGKLYYIKFYSEIEIFGFFIPALHDGDVGMYDFITKTFFCSVNTHTFGYEDYDGNYIDET